MGRIVEQFWSCPYCGQKDIRGRYRECTSCGRPRGEVKFEVKNPTENYISEEEARSIEAAGLAAPSREPDWYCDFCNSLNNAREDTCTSCGSPRSQSTKDYFDLQKTKEPKEESKPPDVSQELRRDSFDVSPQAKIGLFYLATALAMLGFFGLFMWLVSPKSDVLNVTGVGWERSIAIEELKTDQESDWSLPSGARLQTSQRELYGYEQVLDHYETVTETKTRDVVDHYEEYVVGYRDLGNGYAEEMTSSRPVYRTETYTETSQKPVYRSDPVYKTKYYYEIDRWKTTRSVDTEGRDHEPYFGEYELEEKERKGGESSTYYIEAVNQKEQEKRYTLPYEEWMGVNEGDTLSVKVHIFGNIEILDSNGREISVAE